MICKINIQEFLEKKNNLTEIDITEENNELPEMAFQISRKIPEQNFIIDLRAQPIKCPRKNFSSMTKRLSTKKDLYNLALVVYLRSDENCNDENRVENVDIPALVKVYTQTMKKKPSTKNFHIDSQNEKNDYSKYKYLTLENCFFSAQDEFIILSILIDIGPCKMSITNEVAGLVNNGMTCYMNSYLQTIFHLKAIPKYIFKFPIEKSGGWDSEFQSLFYNMMIDKENPIDTLDLTKSFGWDAAQVFTQQDIQEFSCILLDAFENKAKKSGMENFVKEYFGGEMINYIKCVNVDYKSENLENFIDLQLPVKNFKNLYESFDDYTEEEDLSGENQYQTEDYGKQDAKKGVKFKKFPKILMLHLRRFEFNFEIEENIKICDHYKFDEEIDLNKYVHEDYKDQDYTYTLFSILIHLGSGSGSGHYIAFLRPDLNQWYKFNDETIYKVSKEYVDRFSFGGIVKRFSISRAKMGVNYRKTESISQAYMLVYIKNSEIKNILQPIDTNSISKHIKLEVHKKKKQRENEIFWRKHLQIYFTNLEICQNVNYFGPILEYEGANDNNQKQKFFREENKYLVEIFERKMKFEDFLKKISGKTGIPILGFCVFRFDEQKKTFFNITNKKNMKEKSIRTLDALFRNDPRPILLIVPIIENVSLFKINNQSEINKTSSYYFKNLYEFNFNKNCSITDRIEEKFNKISYSNYTLILHKVFTKDNIIKTLNLRFFDKKNTSFPDLLDQLKITSNIIYTEQIQHDEISIDQIEITDEAIENTFSNFGILISLENNELQKDFEKFKNNITKIFFVDIIDALTGKTFEKKMDIRMKLKNVKFILILGFQIFCKRNL